MPNTVSCSVSQLMEDSTSGLAQNEQTSSSSEEEDYGRQMDRALTVEEIDVDLYKSKELWHPIGSRGAYGGQLVAQALRAAWNTVSKEFHVHSLHNYFLLPGNSEIPVIYKVRRVRDGRSFATRVVIATQRGKTVIVCTCSFAKLDGSIHLEHQTPMPDNVPHPESLPSHQERMASFARDERVPREYITRFRNYSDVITPVEYRDTRIDTVEEMLAAKHEPDPRQGQWFKARGRLPDDDPVLHACTIAYASDSGLLMTAVRANGLTGRGRIGMMASLDHSIWFHAPTRADEWLYYDLYSPRSNDGRGTAFGRIYNQQGVLVATTAQEGVIRLSAREQEQRRKQIPLLITDNISKL